MRPRSSLLLVALATTSSRAFADPPRLPDPDDPGDLDALRDGAESSAALPRKNDRVRVAPVWLSLLGWRGAVGGHRETGVGASLSVPFDVVAAHDRDAPHAPVQDVPSLAAAAAVIEESRLAPEQLRLLVRAAWKAAGLAPEEARLADLATRARASAALPELRLKVVRTVDTSLRLTPTDADPYRTTTGDGVGTLYEARATWRLDRLVFADDEVALERVRVERNEQRLKLTIHVVEAIAAWQRAHARSLDPTATLAERADAMVKEIVAAGALDALTDGAFSRLLAARESDAPKR